MDCFHPLIREWFEGKFGEPTDPQVQGWPSIAAGQNTLIAAPTGSGKTLAAFLVSIDRLFKDWLDGNLRDEIDTLYISPLRALSNDIDRNLQQPLVEIRALAESHELGKFPLRTALRTGDTTSAQRQAIVRRPPQILVTTPESLFLLLTSPKGRQRLTTIRTVIVDEIHSLARDKRGSHLALSLQRLDHVCHRRPVRVGLSATQKPIEQIAHFLVGNSRHHAPRDVLSARAGKMPAKQAGWKPAPQDMHHPERDVCFEIIDAGHVRELDLKIEVPELELEAVCSNEHWDEIYQQLTQLIQTHRSTLVFVNTRRMAERVAHFLRETLGEESVASHHGSLAKEIRHSAEQRLKDGTLRAIVATASLEMGIDIGLIDLVCQIGSPRSIANFIQRIGRSGHSLGMIPKGRLFPLTRDELLESVALMRAVKASRLDAIEIPEAPLDILAQQIIAETALEEWNERELFDCFRGSWSYRNLSWEQYDRIVTMVSEGVNPTSKRGAYVHRDRVNGKLRARRGARIAAATSGGAIPETAEYRVVTENERVMVGTVDEDFAIETTAGAIFLLGNNSWQVVHVRGGEMVVRDAHGMPPNIPFWFGEAPGRTIELSEELSKTRQDIADRLRDEATADENEIPASVVQWISDEGCVDEAGARQAANYVLSQVAATGTVPTLNNIVFERFFDESGGTQLVIHAPLGSRINRAWGLALRKRFCRSFDFELQAVADDNGVVLSLSPQHSLPIENLFTMVRADNANYLLEQALLAVPFFQVRWRWNVTRALAVLRRRNGKKVPPHLQRFQSDDLLASAFPETVGCLENHHGDVKIPDHPLVEQTMHDCLHEATDITRFQEVLQQIESNAIELVARETTEPSPFSHELLNANPYAFLDDAPLEERRSRAVATRRTLSPEAMRDLGHLDPNCVRQVRQEAWPLVRDADELHDSLLSLVMLNELQAGEWQHLLQALLAEGRVTVVELDRVMPDDSSVDATSEDGCDRFWVAAEHLPVVQAAFPDSRCCPELKLPESLQREVSRSEARVELVRGLLAHIGPTTVDELAEALHLQPAHVQSALESLEAEGLAMRGHYTDELAGQGTATPDGSPPVQWCDRRLLARIHRLTLSGLRKQIRPVPVSTFYRFVLRQHQLTGSRDWSGPVGLREAISRLQGIDLPAAAWESQILAARLDEYDPSWLDELFAAGEAVWGRLIPPKSNGSANRKFTKTALMTLMLRTDVGWLLPPVRDVYQPEVGTHPDGILGDLKDCGAQFKQDLQLSTGLLPSQLDEVLAELASHGRVTCDAFGVIRDRVSRRPRTRARDRSLRSPQGRWSLFPPRVAEVSREERVTQWCYQLLRRYGVVFRELLSREAAAPRWYELIAVFRRLEMRGEIRGGRFVEGVGGEQFGTEDAVAELRKLRDHDGTDESCVISAADPLNLVGILTDQPRIPVSHRNAVYLENGWCVAACEGVNVSFFGDIAAEEMNQVRQSLLRFGVRPREGRSLSGV